MIKKLLYFLSIVPFFVSGQASQKQYHPSFPQDKINTALQGAYSKSTLPEEKKPSDIRNTTVTTGAFSALQKINYLKQAHPFKPQQSSVQLGDTLIIGTVPHDTLRITGTYFHNGPILVANDAVLIFHNANATIIGDIDVFGNARVLADSSSITFPQQYFYQRALVAVQNSYVHLETCSLSYGGLSHNLLAADSATVELINIHNNDWTTAGTYGKPTIKVDGSNLCGEYIMSDHANASFKNVNTLLVWHQFPDTAVINFSFPDGDTLNHYVFNNTVSGIKGIEYNAVVDSSVNVWWGMMPVNGSDITIADSKIRAIGAWFQQGDTASVSGLVDNSHYSDFTADLPDRNLHLINSTVQTWSLYMFDSSKVSISSCILGEVGSQGRSQVTSSAFFLDGSGGYFWSTDTSIVVASQTAVTANVRSERNSIFIYAYGSLSSGIASAIGNSVVIVVQSALPQDPVAYDGGAAWYSTIAGPSSAFADDAVNINGSAWLDQGPLGSWMSYQKYSLYYQQQGDTTWSPIVKDSAVKIRNSTLGVWNTTGLSPNNYLLLLVTYNDLGDSIQAIKSIALMPSVLAVGNVKASEEEIKVYPNPVNDNLVLDYSLLRKDESATVTIYSSMGEKVLISFDVQAQEEKPVINVSALSSGIYLLTVATKEGIYTRKFLKQ